MAKIHKVPDQFVENEMDLYCDKSILARDVLCHGSFGSTVFRGEHEGISVMIKRLSGILVHSSLNNKIKQDLARLDKIICNQNLVTYISRKFLEPNIWLVMECCDQNLDAFIKETNPVILKRDLIHQVLSGMMYLQSQNIVHGNLKPSNILVCLSKKLVKISDFGLAYVFTELTKHYIHRKIHKGILDWTAPEILEKYGQEIYDGIYHSCESDVFSMGCIIYYIVTDGKHPFGKPYERTYNISKNIHHKIDCNVPPSGVPMIPLINWMISNNPIERPSMLKVTNHCSLWSFEKIRTFFEAVVKVYSKFPEVKDNLKLLEGSKHIGLKNWLLNVDQDIVESLPKNFVLKNGTIIGLVDVIVFFCKVKHFKTHGKNMENKKVGISPDKTIEYFLFRFPHLLEVIWFSLEEFKNLEEMKTFYFPEYSMTNFFTYVKRTNLTSVAKAASKEATNKHVDHTRMAPNETGKAKGRRSKNKSYIVMIGMSGSGKSSTLNSLFDRNATGTEILDENGEVNFRSGTQEILEYEVIVPSETSSEQKLVVIDTPGFHDTQEKNYAKKDSRIMATLENYLKTHAELTKGVYPTAVLLVVDFNDKQINKDESYLVDFLKALEKLIDNYTLVDTGAQTCNLILVLTHFMDVIPEHQKHPEQQVCILKGLFRAFTSIPPNFPVVFAENHAEDFYLKRVKEYYELPNGDLYPYNLYKAIETVARRTEDELGADIIARTFGNPLALRKRITEIRHLLDSNDRHCLKYYYQREISNFKENIVTRKMDELWNKLPPESIQGYGVFLQIAKAVFVSNGIKSLQDLPKTTKDTVDLLQQIPEHPSLELVLRKLGILAPMFWDCTQKVGSFYNVCNDIATDVSPFLCKGTKITGIGYQFPTYLDTHVVSNKHDKRFQQVVWYPTIEAYVSKRLKSLNISFEIGREQSFNAPPKAGCNFQPTATDVLQTGKLLSNPLLSDKFPSGSLIMVDKTAAPKITGILELREYSISLRSDAELRPEYIAELETLPQTFLHWPGAKFAWRNHFANYGSHVIQEAFLGGFVIITAERSMDDGNHLTNNEVIEAFDSMLKKIGNSSNPSDLQELNGWTVKVQYVGGELDVYRPTIDEIFSEKGLKAFSRWADSLKHQPTLLTSQLSLEHICKFVKMKNTQLSEVVSSAANINTGCSLYENEAKERWEYGWCSVM